MPLRCSTITHTHTEAGRPPSALAATLWCHLPSDWLWGCSEKVERGWENKREGIEDGGVKENANTFWVEGLLDNDVRSVCARTFAHEVWVRPGYLFWGATCRRQGQPRTTPSLKHEETYLPAHLWLWVHWMDLGVFVTIWDVSVSTISG